MSSVALDWGILLAQGILSLAMVTIALRLLLGPHARDRVAALDSLYIAMMLLMVTFGMKSRDSFFFEAALVIGLFGFVATAAFAKFLIRGEVVE